MRSINFISQIFCGNNGEHPQFTLMGRNPNKEIGGLIELLELLDSDYDRYLSMSEFIKLLAIRPIKIINNLEKIVYYGLMDETNNLVSFQNIALLYRITFHNRITNVICVILFRGLDTDKDKMIDYSQYLFLIKQLNQSTNRYDLKTFMFNIFKPDRKGKISYKRFTRTLLGYFRTYTSNPFDFSFAECWRKGICHY